MLRSADEVLAQAQVALDALGEIDYKHLDDRERVDTISRVHVLKNRMDAAATTAAEAVDRYVDTGRATPTTWLAWVCHLKKGVARAAVTRSRAMRSMPATAEAYASGAITTDHVRVLAAACRSNEELFAKAEDELLHDATTPGSTSSNGRSATSARSRTPTASRPTPSPRMTSGTCTAAAPSRTPSASTALSTPSAAPSTRTSSNASSTSCSSRTGPTPAPGSATLPL